MTSSTASVRNVNSSYDRTYSENDWNDLADPQHLYFFPLFSQLIPTALTNTVKHKLNVGPGNFPKKTAYT